MMMRMDCFVSRFHNAIGMALTAAIVLMLQTIPQVSGAQDDFDFFVLVRYVDPLNLTCTVKSRIVGLTDTLIVPRKDLSVLFCQSNLNRVLT